MRFVVHPLTLFYKLYIDYLPFDILTAIVFSLLWRVKLNATTLLLKSTVVSM
jgi:hypothetical protein